MSQTFCKILLLLADPKHSQAQTFILFAKRSRTVAGSISMLGFCQANNNNMQYVLIIKLVTIIKLIRYNQIEWFGIYNIRAESKSLTYCVQMSWRVQIWWEIFVSLLQRKLKKKGGNNNDVILTFLQKTFSRSQLHQLWWSWTFPPGTVLWEIWLWFQPACDWRSETAWSGSSYRGEAKTRGEQVENLGQPDTWWHLDVSDFKFTGAEHGNGSFWLKVHYHSQFKLDNKTNLKRK